MYGLLVVLALALIVFGAWAYLRAWWESRGTAFDRYCRDEVGRMPRELRTAKLLASERDQRVELDGDQIPVRPDQVYCTRDDLLIPVETKTRKSQAVYQYDIIELSLQRLAMVQKVGGDRVADYGYVRLVRREAGAKPHYRKVELLPEGKLVALYRRYLGIIAGDITPTHQANPRACQGCSHRKVCASAMI